jgi:hypothetical protein
MAGEGTLGAIKVEMDECSRLVDRARFEWALRHYDHARDAVAEARDGLISFLHCLTTPQFADYELDLFRWRAVRPGHYRNRRVARRVAASPSKRRRR